MSKIHRISAKALTRKIDSSKRRLTAVASSFSVDRDGEVVAPSAFTASNGLDNFTKNPVLAWAHDYKALPVGRAENLQVTQDGLTFDAVFADHEFAEKVWKLYEGGFLNAWSVGYIPKAWSDAKLFPEQTGRTYTDVELLEISAVPVPSNPDALVVARSKGLDVSFIKRRKMPLSKAALKTLTKALEVLKEGRVLSAANRRLIGSCLEQMQSACSAMQELLDATDIDKSADKITSRRDSESEKAEAPAEMPPPDDEEDDDEDENEKPTEQAAEPKAAAAPAIEQSPSTQATEAPALDITSLLASARSSAEVLQVQIANYASLLTQIAQSLTGPTTQAPVSSNHEGE